MKEIICLLIDCLDSLFIRKAFGQLQHTNVVHIHNFVCNDILLIAIQFIVIDVLV